MTDPVRVVVLDHTAHLGGAELALVRLCEALDPSRVQVRAVVLEEGPLVERLGAVGVQVEVLPLPRRVATTDRHRASSPLAAITAAVALIPFLLRLVRLLRRLDADVLHTTSLKADVLSVPVSWFLRSALVWHVHDRIAADYVSPRLVRVLRWLARRVPGHVVVNSQATARTLLPLPRGWTLAYPGLAADQIGPDPVERTGPQPPVVGLVGRISPTKGQREFVGACALLAERFPEAGFRIVGAALFGEREYEQEVRELVADLGLTDRVELTGWTRDPVAAIDGLSVLVHASPVPEPFGQVVVEAMARGVPVVATAGGGIDEIARASGGRLRCSLVEPYDVAGLAEAVAALLEDPAAARARACRAWRDVQDAYGIDRTAARITAAWESTASR